MGDFVVCIDDNDAYNLDKGKRYLVVQTSEDKKWYKVVDNTGNPSTYFGYRFKEEDMSKAEEAKALVQGRKFIVGSFDRDGKFSIASNPRGHATEEIAKGEAQRLATSTPTKTFVVMQMRYGVKAATITEI